MAVRAQEDGKERHQTDVFIPAPSLWVCSARRSGEPCDPPSPISS